MTKKDEELADSVILKREVYEPWDLIMSKLDVQYLTVAEVLRIMNVTRRQLFYWDKKGLRLGKGKKAGRSWRKFSLMDLFGLELTKALLKLNLKLDYCKFIIDQLRERIYASPYFLIHYAIGDHLLLFLDIEQRKVHCIFSGDELFFHKMEGPYIVVSLHTILINIFDYNRRKDFHVEFRRPLGYSHPIGGVFHVDGKPIEFDDSLLDYENIPQQ